MNKAMFFLILLILHLFIAKLEEISAKETASQQATKQVTKVKQTYINLFEQTIGEKETNLHNTEIELLKNPKWQKANKIAIEKYIQKTHQKIQPEEAHLLAELVVKISTNHLIDPKFAAALVSAESGFNAKARNKSGASGLGQLMPSTSRRLGVKNPLDAEDNLKGTYKYIQNLSNFYENNPKKLSFIIGGYLKGTNAIQNEKSMVSRYTLNYIRQVLTIYRHLHEMSEREKGES